MHRRARALAAIAGVVLLAEASAIADAPDVVAVDTATGSSRTWVTADPAVNIPDVVNDVPVSQTIVVSDAPVPLEHVEVGVTISHEYAPDVDLVVTAPDGTTAHLMRWPGGSAGYADLAGRYVFTDIAAQTLDAAVRAASTGVPGAVVPPEAYRASLSASKDAPVVEVSLDDAFAGIDPNGTWTVTARDLENGGSGTLERSDLTVGPDPVVCQAARVALERARARFARAKQRLARARESGNRDRIERAIARKREARRERAAAKRGYRRDCGVTTVVAG